MYPSEMTKLVVANADYPAGQTMVQEAKNKSVLKVRTGFSKPTIDYSLVRRYFLDFYAFSVY